MTARKFSATTGGRLEEISEPAEMMEVGDGQDRCGLTDTLHALVKLYGREAVVEAVKEFLE